MLSIVIPCLDEERTVGAVIQKCRRALDRLSIPYEIIISDNGSTDASKSIALKNGTRVINCPERGYGNALRAGMNCATGDFIIIADADASYDFSEIVPFIDALNSGFEMVVGTRIHGWIEKGAMPLLHRWVGTPLLTTAINILFKTRISDCNCGMRAITRSAYHRIKLISTGMEFASEMIIKAGLFSLKIGEIPIHYYRDKRNRPPHLRRWRDGWKHLRLMLLYAPQHLFFIPAVLFMSIGVLGMSAAILHLDFGFYQPQQHVAVFGSMITVLGFQIFTLGVAAQLFSAAFVQRRSAPFLRIFSLETGLISGCALVILGSIISISIIIVWLKSSFGPLDKVSLLSVAATLIVIGFQTIFSAFLTDIIQLYAHHHKQSE